MLQDLVQVIPAKEFDQRASGSFHDRRQSLSERHIRRLDAYQNGLPCSEFDVRGHTREKGNPCMKASMQSLPPTASWRTAPGA